MEESLDSMDRKTAEFVIRAERLKRSITIFDAIKFLGMEDKVKTLETSSSMACPFHGHDSHYSATIYSDSNMFFCHKCSTYPMDVIVFVSKVKDISRPQALSELEDFADLPPMENLFRDPEPPLPEPEDKDHHLKIEDQILEKLREIRSVANLTQYIKLWQYFDHLRFHYKEFNTLSEEDFTKHLESLDQTLKDWLEHVTKDQVEEKKNE